MAYVYVSDTPGAAGVTQAFRDVPGAATEVLVPASMASGARSPTWSPDGSAVAFAANQGGRDRIAIVQVANGQVRWVAEGDSPAWSPDGKRIALGRNAAQHHHVFTMNAETGEQVVQVTSGDFDHFDPAWSPDGRFIVLSSSRSAVDPAVEGEGRNLFVVAADGTGLTPLTSGVSRAITPCWGRDQWIYFASDREGDYDIWRLRPTGPLAALSPVEPPPQAALSAAPASWSIEPDAAVPGAADASADDAP